jgi:hypothetical protein
MEHLALDKAKVTDSEEHSSLLSYKMYYDRKKFYCIVTKSSDGLAPGANIITQYRHNLLQYFRLLCLGLKYHGIKPKIP